MVKNRHRLSQWHLSEGKKHVARKSDEYEAWK